jgi:hypothetical protein
MRRVRRLLPIVALVLLAPSASAEAASFPLGAGQNPGVAVDGTGLAFIGWQTAQHAIQLCVLPTRARRCSVLANVAFPGDGYDRSRVSVLVGPGTVDVVVPRNAEQGNNTYLARSTDGGATFGPAIRISDQGFEQAVPGPDGRIAMVGGLGLSAGVVAPDGSGRGTEGAELGGGIVGQYGDIATQGAEVVAAGSSAGGAVAFRLPAGGDPNDPGAWQRLADLPRGRQPELAASAHGLVALLEPIRTSPAGLFAQRLTGTGWTPPVRVTSGPLNNDFELAEGGAGRVSALRTDGSPYRIRYATSIDGGTFWSSEVSVARLGGFPDDLEAATAADGRGVAVTTVDGRVVAARFGPGNAPLASRRFGRSRVQVRSLCDGEVNVLLLEAKRAGRRISPSRVLRGASYGRVRGAARVGLRSGAPRYLLNRARSSVAVRLRPRGGRAKTLRLRLHRCG